MLSFYEFLRSLGTFTLLSAAGCSAQSAQSASVGVPADGLQGGATATGVMSSPTAVIAGTVMTFRPQFTVPAEADVGATLKPNIYDPEARDAQSVCPGYKGSNVVPNDLGFTATLSLAGDPCNVYGNDVATLNLSVQYQSADRLSIRILPAVLDASNQSYFQLAESIVPQPQADPDAGSTISESDLGFTWSNDPTFSFTVYRLSTGDTLFSTAGTKIIYEDQFIEFVSALPENYNLYGLGETIHQFRLGNNYTRTFYAADVGDVIDA